ncbi:MAG: metallophosphoesterase [Eubacterium sp.]|nr:metallophosphoesterase [Eubacterium sp.]
MKILVVSDSHGRNSNIDEAIRREKPFDILAFCGDAERSLDEYEFNGYYAPEGERYGFYAVCGNCDWRSEYPGEVFFEAAGHKIYMTHGHLSHIRAKLSFDGLINEGKKRGADVVLFGHTHDARIENAGGILLINPGSLTYPRDGSGIGTYAVLKLEEGKAPKAEIFKL